MKSILVIKSHAEQEVMAEHDRRVREFVDQFEYAVKSAMKTDLNIRQAEVRVPHYFFKETDKEKKLFVVKDEALAAAIKEAEVAGFKVVVLYYSYMHQRGEIGLQITW